MQAARVLSRSMATAPVAQTAFYNCLVVGSGAPAGTMAAALAASGKSVGVIDPSGTIAYSGAFPISATSGVETSLAAAYGDAIPDATAIVSSAKTFSPETNTVTTADGKTVRLVQPALIGLLSVFLRLFDDLALFRLPCVLTAYPSLSLLGSAPCQSGVLAAWLADRLQVPRPGP